MNSSLASLYALYFTVVIYSILLYSMDMLKISVIIVTYNRPQSLECCLSFLSRQTMHPDEVIIIDNGSDVSYEAVMHRYERILPIRYRYVTRQYISVARNQGIAMAKGDIVVFTDDDCMPVPQWLERIIEPFFRDAAIAEVAGRTITAQNTASVITEFLAAVWMPVEHAEGYLACNTEYPFRVCLPTANAAFRRQALVESGLFDEHLETGEDVDVTVRLVKADWKVWFVPDAVVEHVRRATVTGFLKQRYWYGKSYPALFAKHGMRRRTITCRMGNDACNNDRIVSVPFICAGYIDLRFHRYRATLVLGMGLLAGMVLACRFGVGLFILLGIGTVLYAVRCLHCTDAVSPVRKLQFIGIAFLERIACLCGAFFAGFRRGILFIVY